MLKGTLRVLEPFRSATLATSCVVILLTMTSSTILPGVGLLLAAFAVYRFRGAALGLLELARMEMVKGPTVRGELAALGWRTARQLAVIIAGTALVPAGVVAVWRGKVTA